MNFIYLKVYHIKNNNYICKRKLYKSQYAWITSSELELLGRSANKAMKLEGPPYPRFQGIFVKLKEWQHIDQIF